MIHPQRVRQLNKKPVREGRYILYWMQASQRTECNHALEYAIRQANNRNVPLVVLFVLINRYPEANLRHYTFMAEGLQEVRQGLEKRGIAFVLRCGHHETPETEVVKLGEEATMIVADRGYLRFQQDWRRRVATAAPCLVTEVETDVIIPVDAVSAKAEYSAATLRPKISRLLPDYLLGLSLSNPRRSAHDLKIAGIPGNKPWPEILAALSVDLTVQPGKVFIGGTSHAGKRLEVFLNRHLQDYPDRRNDPAEDISSQLSPYLHFGQISPLFIALKTQQMEGIPDKAKAAYLEELIVRRELGMNFVHHNENYDRFDVLPAWAKMTLDKHRGDVRPIQYSLAHLDGAKTHDPYWNAAQQEMVRSGKMHNYMRMYWGKKILEWSLTPEEAWETALYLNNRYELDGRDPNSYAGIAWCFGKHDRPWAERPVFGTVRYMNSAGLERKFTMKRYIERVTAL